MVRTGIMGADMCRYGRFSDWGDFELVGTLLRLPARVLQGPQGS
jgi:hypothetical protein